VNYRLLIPASALLALAACGGKPPEPAPVEAPPPPVVEAPDPINIEEVIERSATVEAINLEKRLVTLKAEDGEVFTVEAGPEVRNLPQVEVGDMVVARYYRAVGARLSTTATPDAPVIDLAGERAAEGERPAGAIGTQATVPVTIVATRDEGKVVSFYGEDGLVRVLEVQTPAAQEFVRGLKEGDKVELTFTEALAISVEPATPADAAMPADPAAPAP
jgi:hypothetical protein